MQGRLILILGPSGSGKGTLIRHVKKTHSNFVFPISCTTRTPRPRENDGEVYYFISKDEFQQKIDNGDFLEWAVVHGDNYYGTLKSEIIDPLLDGKTVFREVDVQGVKSIKKLIPEANLTTIFITTPDWNDLKKRITGRAQISAEELEKRHQSYKKELDYKGDCDYVVVNRQGQIKQTKARLEAILSEL